MKSGSEFASLTLLLCLVLALNPHLVVMLSPAKRNTTTLRDKASSNVEDDENEDVVGHEKKMKMR